MNAAGSWLLTAAVVALVCAASTSPELRAGRAGRHLVAVRRGVHRARVWWTRRVSGHSVLRAIGWVLLSAAAALTVGRVVPVWALVPAVVWVLAVAGRPGPAPKPEEWWAHGRLLGAMVAAGVLRHPPAGQPRLMLSYHGQPQHTEHATVVVVSLPAGKTISDVTAKREALAGALRVPSARLDVSQLEDDPAGVVRIRVGTPGQVREQPAEVATAERTEWFRPVRIGHDHGVPVYLETFEQNTIVAGIMGTGKTSFNRMPLGHYLLDPTTELYGVDGKGSARDYAACQPMFKQWVSGSQEDAAEATLAMFEEYLSIVRARNASGEAYHPGMLLLLEEYQDIRAGATSTQQAAMDTALGRIERLHRAVGGHVLISTQRPSVDDLPSGSRNLISQRLTLMVRSPEDAKLVLGMTPRLPLPKRRGQALYATPAGLQQVRLDRMTDEAWAALCVRAMALRAPVPAPRAEAVNVTTGEVADGGEDQVEAVPAPRDETARLLQAVVDVLAGDPAGMTASALLEALPGWVQDRAGGTAQGLAFLLRDHSRVVEKGYRGSARVWRLAAATPAAGRKASVGAR